MAKKYCNDYVKNGTTFSFSRRKKNNIEIDLKFLESMKTDRKATYGSLYTASIKRNEKRQRKASKEISEPSSSSVLQSQDTSDIPLDGSFVQI